MSLKKVWIHAMGSYYGGIIIKTTDKRALVEYTSGAGKTRQKWVTFDAKTQKYINSKYETNFPLVDGDQPQPKGARATTNERREKEAADRHNAAYPYPSGRRFEK